MHGASLKLGRGVVDVEQNDGDDGLREDEVAENEDEHGEDTGGGHKPSQFQLLLDARPAVTLFAPRQNTPRH